MSASNAVGLVGKWGQTSYVAVKNPGGADAGSTTPRPNKAASKIFKSRAVPALPPPTPPPSGRTPSSPLPSRPPAPSTPMRRAAESGRVEVVVRVRPLLEGEKVGAGDAKGGIGGDGNVVEADSDKGEIFVNFDKAFKFDRVLDNTSCQADVFSECVRPVMSDSLAQGRHLAVIAYGQTGTGKTFTMGTEQKISCLGEDRGIIARAVEEAFESSKDLTVKVSFFEILNDRIYDLINPHNLKVPLKLKEVGHEFIIPDLTTRVAEDVAQTMDLLCQGSAVRSTGATAQNESSSRSHAVFRLTLEGPDLRVPLRMSFVDLAGSESTARAETAGERRQEGVSINKALSTLRRCVSSICNKESHVPFRDSSLTKVLRESFTGGGITSLIACVSPTEADLRETISTLRYADSVKGIKKPEIPMHLVVQSELYQSAKKRRLDMIPPTPSAGRRFNSTIATPTPTKRRKVLSAAPRMNSTIGGSSAANSGGTFSTPSFLASKTPSLETIQDEDDAFSDVSSIRGGLGSSGNTSSVSASLNNSVVADQFRSVLSPMMRQMKEMRDLQDRMQEMMKEQTSIMQQSCLLGSTVRRSPRLAAAAAAAANSSAANIADDSLISGDDTVISGPALAAGRENVRRRQQDEVATPPPANRQQSAAVVSENDIQKNNGGTPNLRHKTPLRNITNVHRDFVRRVEDAASPELAKKSDASKTPKKSVDEMAAALGINVDSPSLLFSAKKPRRVSPNGSIMSSKRSSRRTTMMRDEIRASMAPAAVAKQGAGLRRSSRLSVLMRPVTHAIEEKSCWRVKNQRQHNDKILEILNTANLKVLQTLPGIGPKTAISIHSFRELNSHFGSLSELENVKGVSKNFFRKFCERNQIVL